MPARSALVVLSAAHLYLVNAPAGLAASALKCGPLSNCLIAPRVGQVCWLLPDRSLYLVDALAGLAASALNCGPLSDCLIAPRVGQVCLLHSLQGTVALPSHCSVLKRVCASI